MSNNLDNAYGELDDSIKKLNKAMSWASDLARSCREMDEKKEEEEVKDPGMRTNVVHFTKRDPIKRFKSEPYETEPEVKEETVVKEKKPKSTLRFIEDDPIEEKVEETPIVKTESVTIIVPPMETVPKEMDILPSSPEVTVKMGERKVDFDDDHIETVNMEASGNYADLEKIITDAVKAGIVQNAVGLGNPTNRDRQVDLTINAELNKVNKGGGLRIPITFDKTIEADGSITTGFELINELSGQNDIRPLPFVDQFPIPIYGTDGWIDNSLVISRYGQLKPIERAIREEGLDCLMFENPSGLIQVAVYYNGVGNVNGSFSVDLKGVVLSPTAKWFNIYQPISSPIEHYCAIPIGRTDLIRKFVKMEASFEELNKISLELYPINFLQVYEYVDLRSIPFNVSIENRNLIVDRLHSAFFNASEDGKPSVLNQIKSPIHYKFEFKDYHGPYSYHLVSEYNGIKLDVSGKNFNVKEFKI